MNIYSSMHILKRGGVGGSASLKLNPETKIPLGVAKESEST